MDTNETINNIDEYYFDEDETPRRTEAEPYYMKITGLNNGCTCIDLMIFGNTIGNPIIVDLASDGGTGVYLFSDEVSYRNFKHRINNTHAIPLQNGLETTFTIEGDKRMEIQFGMNMEQLSNMMGSI
uniref:CUB domain-containing protein n=1 Tax=Rhabditophanes sp. KR3021 TaxID=114890 RepID=A0AC35THQ6_9BILA